MLKFVKKISKKTGLPPGALVHVGEKKIEKTRIRVIDYDETRLEERELAEIEACFPHRDTSTVTWINIDGLHEVEVIEKIGNHFGLHPLVLEDIVNTGQRPKLEDFDEYLFIICKMLFFDEEEGQIRAEQISLILGPKYVLSFQERAGDVFNSVRERLGKGKGRIRKRSTDYLVYALIDSIADHYFIILEKIAEKLEVLEEELMTEPTPGTLETIHRLRRELIFMRKFVWPARELISAMERGESNLIHEKTIPFLRDVYDHTTQVVETLESFRDMVSGMLDVYLSNVSNRMNEVMKVLTIIATLFIPLTFIAGIYGMNFEYMPELKWHWGYFFVWGIMIALALVMFIYIKRKRWL